MLRPAAVAQYGTSVDHFYPLIGDQLCDMGFEGVLNKDPVTSGGDGTAKCIVQSGEAGPKALSVYVKNAAIGYGLMMISDALTQVSALTGRAYGIMLHPVVRGLSQSSSGTNGGSMLTITGAPRAANPCDHRPVTTVMPR
jgi:hypothetical protein